MPSVSPATTATPMAVSRLVTAMERTERSAPRFARPRCGPQGRISATIRRCAASSNPAARSWFTVCKAARRIWCAMPTRRRRSAISSTMTTRSDDPRASGHIGSVRIYTTPCAPAGLSSGRLLPIRLVAAAVVVVVVGPASASHRCSRVPSLASASVQKVLCSRVMNACRRLARRRWSTIPSPARASVCQAGSVCARRL